MRGAWIEILFKSLVNFASESLPMRGAWIEISRGIYQTQSGRVAPHAGSVD